MQATMLSFPYCGQFNSGGGRSSSVTGSPVGSPSPPLTIPSYGHSYVDGRYGSPESPPPPVSTSSLPLCLKTNYQSVAHHHHHQQQQRLMGRSSPSGVAANYRKAASKSSFTIEAILGIQNDDEERNSRRQISASLIPFAAAAASGVHPSATATDTLFYGSEGPPPIPQHHLSGHSTTQGRSGNCFGNGQSARYHSHHHHHHSISPLHHQQPATTSNAIHQQHPNHHVVPTSVDPTYICTPQRLSPPCLSPDSTRKDKPSPLRRSYQSQHSPSSADSDQSTSTTGSHRLTPKMSVGGGGNHHSPMSTAKSKRVRTIFTPEQLERLEREFERQQYMVGPERLYLASALQLSEAQVKVWFQNRRIKWRKQHLEMQQARLAKFRGGSDSDESQMAADDVIQDV